MTSEVIDVESRELAVVESTPALFGTTEPTEIVAKAGMIADALKDVIRKQGLISNIQGKEYVRVEGWTLLGSMLGVFPITVWTREVEGGWEARVEARTLTGAVVGAAEAQCTTDERTWSKRDGYALRSMAQTRATSKAMRMPLGFVVTLAGFEATPAEEMTFEHDESRRPDAARIPGGVQREFKPQSKPDLPTPLCPTHQQECDWVKAGVNKDTKKPYSSFYVCPEKSCTAGHRGRKWSIFTSEWDDQLRQKEQLAQPSEPMIKPDELPFE